MKGFVGAARRALKNSSAILATLVSQPGSHGTRDHSLPSLCLIIGTILPNPNPECETQAPPVRPIEARMVMGGSKASNLRKPSIPNDFHSRLGTSGRMPSEDWPEGVLQTIFA